MPDTTQIVDTVAGPCHVYPAGGAWAADDPDGNEISAGLASEDAAVAAAHKWAARRECAAQGRS